MKSFPSRILEEIDATKYMKIRAGDHRYIWIWVVVVDGRVVVRSWNDKPGGWYRAFLKNSSGSIQLGDKDVPIRGRRLRNAKLNDATDDAYARKYVSKSSLKYVKGFKTARRKSTSLELLPA